MRVSGILDRKRAELEKTMADWEETSAQLEALA
jgi:hypothetical protein